MVAINGTSTGYLGSSGAPSIDTVEWASLQHAFGQEYFVATSAAGKVTVVSGTTVRVAAGVIGGRGVVDTFTGTRSLTLPTPGTDGTIHYLVAARRTWQTAQATTIEYVTGTSARAIPAGRNVNPGVIDDHPLALVAVTKNGATVTAVVVDDLRAVGYGSGSYEATSELVLSYMDKPGYRIRIAGTEWLRKMDNTWARNVALPRYGQHTEYAPASTGTKNSDFYYWGANITPRSYIRRITWTVSGYVSVTQGSIWRLLMQTADIGSPVTIGAGTDRLTYPLVSPSGSGNTFLPFSATYDQILAAGDGMAFRAWLDKDSGGSLTVYDLGGVVSQVSWNEVQAGNDW